MIKRMVRSRCPDNSATERSGTGTDASEVAMPSHQHMQANLFQHVHGGALSDTAHVVSQTPALRHRSEVIGVCKHLCSSFRKADIRSRKSGWTDELFDQGTVAGKYVLLLGRYTVMRWNGYCTEMSQSPCCREESDAFDRVTNTQSQCGGSWNTANRVRQCHGYEYCHVGSRFLCHGCGRSLRTAET